MRKPIIGAAVTVAAVCAGSVPVLAQSDNPSQTVLSGSAQVSPNRAGTKHKPAGVKLTVKVHWETPAAIEKPVTKTATVLFPKGSLYNGKKYPKCSAETMSRKGIDACPKRSIMGTGTGVAYADTVFTKPDITVVNGGSNMVYLFTVLKNPARVAAPVPGKITRMSGKWAYKLELTVPPSLQIVAGVPIALRDITIMAGRKSWAKDWLATTSCPSGGRWPFSLTTDFDNGGSANFDSNTKCRR